MRKLWLLVAPALLVAGGLVSFIGAKSQAASESSQPSLQIQVAPIEFNLSLSPGQLYDGQFKVINSGTSNHNFVVNAKRFYVKDVSYETIFDKELAFTQIADWVSFDKTEFNGLKPGETQTVDFQIKVPNDAPGGGQYAVIFVNVEEEQTESSYKIIVKGHLGMMIYAKVSGETRSEGKVESLEQAKFFTKSSISSAARIKNSGNVDFDSRHELTVKSITGKKLFSDSVSKRIMPDTTRAVELKWDEAPSIGLFRVQNKISFLGKVQYDQEILVLVMPSWLAVIAIIILVVIVGLIVGIIVYIVKKKRLVKGEKTRKTASTGVKKPKKRA